LSLGVHDALDDAEEVKGAERKPVDPCHRHHIAGAEPVEHLEKRAPVRSRSCHLLAVDLPATAPGSAKLLKLGVEGLPVGRDAGIADKSQKRSKVLRASRSQERAGQGK